MTDDWTLTDDQLTWMLQHQQEIDAAYLAEDMDWLRTLERTADYQRVFGDMNFDEAIDRWECMGDED